MYYPVGWPKKLNFRFKAPLSDNTAAVPHQNGFIPGHTEDAALESEVFEQATNLEASNKRILQVVANTDRSSFVVLTDTSVHVWFCKVSPVR